MSVPALSLVDSEALPPAPSAPSLPAMSRLVQAVRDLAAARDLERIVEIVRHAARELVDADGATFVLRDAGQCFYVDEDAIQPLWRGQRFPLQACISGWAMLNGEQVVIPDIYLDDRIPHVAYRPTFVRSLVMTPIRTAEPVGSIGTYWADEHEATPAERELLLALADSTSVAMESIRLLDELEGRVAERTRELEATNRDLAAFAHVAAHDLKAPLATISGYAELIADMEAASLSAEGTSALGAVRRQATRMSDLIDAVLAYSTATTTALELEVVDLGEVTASVLRDLEELIVARGAEVEVGDLPSMRGCAALLERVVQNLVVNAINYGDSDAPVVHVDGKVVDGAVRLTISDNGLGVAPEERETIFDMFMRGRAGSLQQGSGIGLAFARRVVARHGGTLTVSSAEGGGACFTLELPDSSAQPG
ncbi:ATP-binding protein [Nocardioides psychrotolerans]|uniref:sensor histidine kinase n=1 Tax=Nocardioides psychrotolerans TaxID=1005945 RepID=UPI003137D100